MKKKLSFFRKKLAGHCLYDFWFALLENANTWGKMFSSDNLVPHQILSLAFQFAIINGYFELVTFIWNNITDSQREFIGISLPKFIDIFFFSSLPENQNSYVSCPLIIYRIIGMAKSMF